MAELTGTLTRRAVLQATTGALALPYLSRAARAGGGDDPETLFAELDARILKGMEDLSVPGCAVAVVHGDKTHLRAFGVVDNAGPAPVDADSLFRIASNSKTFTGTAAMALADAGKLDLDRQVQAYVPEFVAPETAQNVTVRQVLNHSAGWLGYDYHNTGPNRDALARYVHDVQYLPQLTPVGTTFSYNNAAISVAGRVIEAVTREPYELAIQDLLFTPLDLQRSGYWEHEPPVGNVAKPHDVDKDGRTVVVPDYFFLPRGCDPFGGIWSSARDMLAYLQFHLGDGRAGGGRRIMSKEALRAMQVPTGPGGTLFVELTGVGVSWMIRPTAEGVPVVQHGGDLSGYHSGFIMVPERRFGMTLLTNSESGHALLGRFFTDDRALRRFAGVSNLPATPRKLTAAELAPYVGVYTAQQINIEAKLTDCVPQADTGSIEMKAADGDLTMLNGAETTLAFYKDDYVVAVGNGGRASFLRAADGSVEWFRVGGRLYRKA